MDEIKNESEEIVATNEETNEEAYYVDDDCSASNLPAVGVGIAIGAIAAVGIPKLAKGVKKVASGVTAKAKAKVAGWAANNSKDSNYIECNGKTEEEED